MNFQDCFYSTDLLERLMAPFQTAWEGSKTRIVLLGKPRLREACWRSLTTWGLEQACLLLPELFPEPGLPWPCFP